MSSTKKFSQREVRDTLISMGKANLAAKLVNRSIFYSGTDTGNSACGAPKYFVFSQVKNGLNLTGKMMVKIPENTVELLESQPSSTKQSNE